MIIVVTCTWLHIAFIQIGEGGGPFWAGSVIVTLRDAFSRATLLVPTVQAPQHP